MCDQFVSCAVNILFPFAADIADKSGSGRNGNGEYRRIPRSEDTACFETVEGRLTLGRHEGRRISFE